MRQPAVYQEDDIDAETAFKVMMFFMFVVVSMFGLFYAWFWMQKKEGDNKN